MTRTLSYCLLFLFWDLDACYSILSGSLFPFSHFAAAAAAAASRRPRVWISAFFCFFLTLTSQEKRAASHAPNPQKHNTAKVPPLQGSVGRLYRSTKTSPVLDMENSNDLSCHVMPCNVMSCKGNAMQTQSKSQVKLLLLLLSALS